MKKSLKDVKSRIYDDATIIKANEENELNIDEKGLEEKEEDWDKELKEEKERGYSDYNWHEGDYDS